MARGPPLTADEQFAAVRMQAGGNIVVDIAKALNRSPGVISRFLSAPATYNTKRSPGRPREISKNERRAISRELEKGNTSCDKIRRSLGLTVSKVTVWREIMRQRQFRYRRMQRVSILTARHKQHRMEFSTKHAAWGKRWDKVIFSDEKRFNLDGPDGYKSYWHKHGTPQKSYVRRHSGGKSTMVWAAISALGKSEISFVDVTMDAEKYGEVLEETLLPFAYAVYGNNFIFMQDNAPCHTSQGIREWFKHLGISVMRWPALSPDLNPIENVWSLLSRMVYSNGKQYTTLEDLKTAIQESWENLSSHFIQNNIRSMPDRCVKVIQRNGDKISY